MRVALISDIHANLVALDAALDDMREARVDQVVCLGDIADLGPQPAQTLARLRQIGCPCVAGNHDPFTEQFPGLMDVIDWCREQLSSEAREYLASLPSTLTVELAPGAQLLCTHGSPDSYDFQFISTTTDAELDAWALAPDVRVVVCGHTHVQLLRRHRTRTFVNVGSVGQPFVAPFDGKTPPRCLKRVEYAIISWEDGALGVDLRSLPLNWDAYRQAVLSSGFPAPHAWLRHWDA